MPSTTKRSKISSHLETSKVYVLGGYLSFFDSSGFFPFDGLNNLHAYGGPSFNSTRLISLSSTIYDPQSNSGSLLLVST